MFGALHYRIDFDQIFGIVLKIKLNFVYQVNAFWIF